MIADFGRPAKTELPSSSLIMKERVHQLSDEFIYPTGREDDVFDGVDAVGRNMMTSLSRCFESCRVLGRVGHRDLGPPPLVG